MLVDGSYEILSCDDVELGIKRDSSLSFYACYDDVKEAKALLVIIPVFSINLSARVDFP